MNRLIPGSPVSWKDREWVLIDIPTLDQALVRDPETGRMDLAPTSDLKSTDIDPTRRHGLMTISKVEWTDAWTRLQAMQPLLNRSPRDRTAAEIDAIAERFGKDRATIYRWIKRWESTRTVTTLIRKGREDIGKSRLLSPIDVIIKHQVETYYLTPERPTVVELSEKIEGACRAAGLPPPAESTVRRRIKQLHDRLVMSKRFSPKQAREKFEPLRGSFPGADTPLAVYQIDHSPIDVILVDEVYRRPIGRGSMTIVTDSCTRMLAGFCASLDPPGALSTGLAMVHAMLPKTKWLLDRNINATWPIYGKPTKIFVDNAAEFRGTMVERASQEHLFLIENRPKGLPNYGGYVERLFRTFMKRAQRLPGTTFSNVQERSEYDSEGRAIMTLTEFEKWFGVFVTMVYHQRRHRGIGNVPPVKLYEQLVLGTDDKKGIGLPEPIHDEFKLQLDFMPYIVRTIQEYGALIDYIYYYADVLRPWIHARDKNNSKLKRKFVFVRDPRDISMVYFLDPDTKTYYPVPYKNITHPRMSIWDLNAILKKLADHPELQPNEDLIFEGLAEMSRIQEESAAKSKTARRTQQRRSNWRTNAITQTKATESNEVASTEWNEVITPFDDIEESV